MKRKFERVYQFKITLKGIKPAIWRQIQVPETFSFWDLHVAIQDVMGWLDYHLHQFSIVNPSSGMKVEIGIPDDEFDIEGDIEILPGWKEKISAYFSLDNTRADYIYDFGDHWEHALKLEKMVPREKDILYPICINGERSCPPEDCGGQWGYKDFLENIMDPNHEQYHEMLEWVGGEFDPEHFDIKEVIFDNPDERKKIALS